LPRLWHYSISNSVLRSAQVHLAGKRGTVGEVRVGRARRGSMGDKLRMKKVLVVDDEDAVRSLCAACIQHGLGDDYEVFEAADGEEAMAAVEADRPDLILLDILMPEMDGFEVCRRLKGSPETRDIPIVFLTALGEEKDVERGLALGGDGYIVKPFNAVTLAAQVSEILAPNCDR